MVSLVIPTYNEREVVGTLLERVFAALKDLSVQFEVLVMDDRSPDGTAAEARAACRRLGAEQHVRVVERGGKKGLAEAALEGFSLARGEILIVMDADLSHPPEVLKELLEPAVSGRADLVVASRYIPGGGTKNWPLLRRIVSRVAGLLARPLAKVKDATSGFFAVRRSAIEGVPLRPVGYKIGLEVFVKSRASSVVEVPYVFRDRAAGKSKLGARVTFLYLLQFFKGRTVFN